MTALTRGIRSELSRWSWRSPVLYSFVPLAILIPVILNAAIAVASQSDLLPTDGGMETENSGYWVIIFTTFILMLAGISSTCGEYGNGTIGTYLAIQPKRWVLPMSKLITYGGLGFLVSLMTIAGIVGLFPLIFPDVWGAVSITSSSGLRLVYGVPLLTFFTCALGIGLSLLVHRSGVVVMLVLLWKFGIEVFFTFIPGDLGLWLQRLSPFKNGELGAGQVATIDSPFGGGAGSLAYFAVLCAVFFVWGVVRLHRADIRD
ncbi:ABC transporter permease [Gordonia iterans]